MFEIISSVLPKRRDVPAPVKEEDSNMRYSYSVTVASANIFLLMKKEGALINVVFCEYFLY